MMICLRTDQGSVPASLLVLRWHYNGILCSLHHFRVCLMRPFFFFLGKERDKEEGGEEGGREGERQADRQASRQRHSPTDEDKDRQAGRQAEVEASRTERRTRGGNVRDAGRQREKHRQKDRQIVRQVGDDFRDRTCVCTDIHMVAFVQESNDQK